MIRRSWSALTVALAAASLAQAQTTLRITTADGRGADATIAAAAPDRPRGEEALLALRFDPAGNASEKTYLRFDLTPIASRQVTEASLTLQPLGGYHGRHDYNVFGLPDRGEGGESARGVWSESVLTWANGPGHDPSAGGGYWETEEVRTEVGGMPVTQIKVVSAGGTVPTVATYLGRISVRPGDSGCRLTGAALADYLNAGGKTFATLLLTRADAGPGATTFASGEHPVFDPPRLVVTTVREAEPLAGALALVTCPGILDGKEKPLEMHWLAVQTKAARAGWKPVLGTTERLSAAYREGAEGMDGATDAAAGSALAAMLQTETRYLAGELTERVWADGMAEILCRHPARSDDLLYAFMTLAGMRRVLEPEFALTTTDLRPLLQRELPPAGRSALVEFVSDVIERPGSLSAEDRVAHYRRLIPSAYGGPAEPYILIEYVKALREVEGEAAVAAYLDQLVAFLPDDPISAAAAVLRVGHETDPAARDAMVIRLVEERPEAALAAVLRPYYLGAKQRDGKLDEAMERLDPHGRLAGSQAGADRAEAIYDVLAQHTLAEAELDRFPSHELARLDLGPRPTPLALMVALAEAKHEAGDYGAATELLRAAARREGVRVPEVVAPAEHDWRDSDGDAASSLLLAVCRERLGDDEAAERRLREALETADHPLAKAHALFLRGKRSVAAGDAEGGLQDAEEALALAPGHSLLARLREAADGARPQGDDRLGAETEAAELMRLGGEAADASESARAYRAAAELQDSIGHREQAIAAYLAIAKKHPDSPQAAEALADAVRLLEARQDGDSQQRAQTMRALIAERYGQDRADELLAKGEASAEQ